MSLRAKDIVLSVMVTFAVVAAMYVQYFSPMSTNQYAIYWWVGVVVILLLFLKSSQQGKDFISYAKAAKLELRKVVWPSKDDVVSATIAVGVAVVIFSVLVSFLDTMLVKLLSYIIG